MDPKDLDYCALSEIEAQQKTVLLSLVAEAKAEAQAEILLWAMKVCGTGATVGMIRKILHNKYVELTGEGEKA